MSPWQKKSDTEYILSFFNEQIKQVHARMDTLSNKIDKLIFIVITAFATLVIAILLKKF